MASENFIQVAIPCFDGHYDHWSMLMENFVMSKEFCPVVTIGIQDPTALSETQKAELDSIRLKDLKSEELPFSSD